MPASVSDHGVGCALHGMGHQVGKISEDAAVELDDVVVATVPGSKSMMMLV